MHNTVSLLQITVTTATDKINKLSYKFSSSYVPVLCPGLMSREGTSDLTAEMVVKNEKAVRNDRDQTNEKKTKFILP
jgi:hypothetical protein